jgi:hypothetical protein
MKTSTTDYQRAAAPGRHQPEVDGLRQATNSPQGLFVSGLSPKQGPTLSEGRSSHSASGVLS